MSPNIAAMNLKTWCDQKKGRQRDLAAFLGKPQSAVNQAVNGGIPIPVAWYRKIVEFTRNRVKLDDLVPKAPEAEKAPEVEQ